MKKICATIFALIMGLTLIIPATNSLAINAVLPNTVKTTSVGADILVDTTTNVIFTCEPESLYADGSYSPVLVDETGSVIATFNDNGTNGDKTSGDGIYSVSTKLHSNERKLVNYTVTEAGRTIDSYEINFYTEITENDHALHDAIWSDIESMESQLEKENADDNMILDSVYNYLLNADGIESITRENDYSIGFVTDAGIHSVFVRWQEDSKGVGSTESQPMVITNDGMIELSDIPATNGELSSWRNPNILVIRPFRHDPEELGFANENYTNAAKSIQNITNGIITVIDDENTHPLNLKENFYKNGFVLVDSHGIDYQQKSYICVSDGEGYTSADLSAGRIISIGYYDIGVTGTYFQHYYEESNITFENTFFYFGICLGMKYPSLNQPLLELGASAVVGYNESVTFGYEALMISSLINHMTDICAEDETRTYTVEESVQYAKDENGDVDIYNGIAVMVMEGNGNFVITKSPVAAESIAFDSESMTCYVNNSYYIAPVVLPLDACGYDQTWQSSDESVVRVDGPRSIFAVGEGTATITCTLSGSVNGTPYEHTASVEITVDFSHITDINASAATQLDIGEQGLIDIKIAPDNASDKTVFFISNNPGVVTVDETGMITAHMPGTASIICRTNDGGLEDVIEITVRDNPAYVLSSNNEFTYGLSYSIVEGDDTAMTSLYDDGYLRARDIETANGYITGGNTNNAILWTFEEAPGGFYIKSINTGEYLSDTDEGMAELTNSPESIFVFEDDRIKLVNPIDPELQYLRVRSGYGFAFGRPLVAASCSLYEYMDFENINEFITLTFVDHNDSQIATQMIRSGGKATAAVPSEREGYTFLGWDASMMGLTQNTTVRPLYREGTTDKCVITFMDSIDNTVISTVEVDFGDSITAPNPPEHEGLDFICWSEDISSAVQNMTVFAIYGDNAILGDVNDNDSVDTGDAATILRYSVGLTELSGDQLRLADINGDSLVNTADAAAVLQLAVGVA